MVSVAKTAREVDSKIQAKNKRRVEIFRATSHWPFVLSKPGASANDLALLGSMKMIWRRSLKIMFLFGPSVYASLSHEYAL